VSDFLNLILPSLQKVKKADSSTLETNLEKLINSFYPKNSITLFTNFYKKIFTTTDNITLILLGHLYIERLLNEILHKSCSIQANELKKLNTFYKKVIFLNAESKLDNDFVKDILLINNLRNCLAHELNYKLSDFDVWEFSALKSYKRDNFEPKNNAAKEVFIRLILKIYFYKVYQGLAEKFRFLILLNKH